MQQTSALGELSQMSVINNLHCTLSNIVKSMAELKNNSSNNDTGVASGIIPIG